MLHLTLVFAVALKLAAGATSESVQDDVSSLEVRREKIKVNKVFNEYLYSITKSNHTTQVYDDGEMLMRYPTIDTSEKRSRKLRKKTPKRTIQKIIKKSKAKQRRAYLFQMTSMSTIPTEAYDKVQEDLSETTTQVTMKKKFKKWNNKRQPMPFHKLQPRKNRRSIDSKLKNRNKREANRSDLFILQDLDEMEFLGKEDGNDIVETHVKSYWK